MTGFRTVRFALAIAAGLAAGSALAQTGGSPATGAASPGATGVSGREVTSTGATVPNPGTDKTGPETTRERRAQERSDRVTRSICTGC